MVIIRAKMSIKLGKIGKWIQDCVAELLRVITLSCRQEMLVRLTRSSNVDLRHHIILLDMMTMTDESDENSSWLDLRVCRVQIWAVSWETQPGWRAGWLAGWEDSYLEDRLSQLRWSISTSHKSSDSESPGWAVSEAILPALGCAPRRLLGGQRLGSVDPFSCMTHSSFSPNGAGGHGAVADWGG